MKEYFQVQIQSPAFSATFYVTFSNLCRYLVRLFWLGSPSVTSLPHAQEAEHKEIYKQIYGSSKIRTHDSNVRKAKIKAFDNVHLYKRWTK